MLFVCEKREKTSQYKGVYWLTEKGKWCVQLRLKGVSQYGGAFEDELDAARRVNHLCKKFGIPLKNLEISTIPNEQYPVTTKFICRMTFGENQKCENLFFHFCPNIFF